MPVTGRLICVTLQLPVQGTFKLQPDASGVFNKQNVHSGNNDPPSCIKVTCTEQKQMLTFQQVCQDKPSVFAVPG